MAFTAQQLVTLGADSQAAPVLAAFSNTPDGNTFIVFAYQQVAVPDFWVWKTDLRKVDITQGTGPEGTIFTWVGNGFITRSVQELITWQELFSRDDQVDASKPQNRSAFQDIFSGAGNAALNRTHCQAVARRRASWHPHGPGHGRS